MALSTSYGRISSAQSQSEMSVASGTDGHISSRTDRWNRFRVSWMSGKDSYGNFNVDGGPGDVLVIVQDKSGHLLECNWTTGERFERKVEVNTSLLVVFFLLIPLFGLGIILIAIQLITANRKYKAQVQASNAELERITSEPRFADFVAA